MALPYWIKRPLAYALLFALVMTMLKVVPSRYVAGMDKCSDMRLRMLMVLVFMVLSLFVVKFINDYDWRSDMMRIVTISLYLTLLYFFVSSVDFNHFVFGHISGECLDWKRIGLQSAGFFVLAMIFVLLPISCF